MGKSIFTEQDKEDIILTADAFREFYKKDEDDAEAAIFFILLSMIGVERRAMTDDLATALFSTLMMRLEDLKDGKRK